MTKEAKSITPKEPEIRNDKEIIESLFDLSITENDKIMIKSFAYYLTSRREHLYNLGFYTTEFTTFMVQLSKLTKKKKHYDILFNTAITLTGFTFEWVQPIGSQTKLLLPSWSVSVETFRLIAKL